MRKEGAQIFVKVDEYKDILELVGTIKAKLEDAKETLNKINEMKNDEDSELDLWHTEIEEIEKKVEHVDKVLFEPESL
ncbi:MAG: hypothetical protein QS98_C0005G0014 [archaeon GW2011_AR3]|nr:MAG: hypothetical protein QS98_C0005G0014 [archaeon GW2011_AR3]MBS3109478.1 hypothetical protein [Candidatus Woesearchaeota archaeon]